jgi:hypothetical protein
MELYACPSCSPTRCALQVTSVCKLAPPWRSCCTGHAQPSACVTSYFTFLVSVSLLVPGCLKSRLKCVRADQQQAMGEPEDLRQRRSCTGTRRSELADPTCRSARYRSRPRACGGACAKDSVQMCDSEIRRMNCHIKTRSQSPRELSILHYRRSYADAAHSNVMLRSFNRNVCEND